MPKLIFNLKILKHLMKTQNDNICKVYFTFFIIIIIIIIIIMNN